VTFGDPFRNSGLCEPLAVPIRKLPVGGPDWEEPAADMLATIASPTDPAETATNGCAKRDNHDALQQMRQVDRSVWAAGEHRLADRNRELREQRNE
jgi:hypothetical protein